jgi:hypothetical protein
VNWIWFILLPLGFVAFVLVVGRRHVAIRRKDCCGKGCGCLFPVKPKK